jgi:ribosomal protein S17E
MNKGVPDFVTNLLLVVALGCLVFISIRIKELLRVGRRDSKEHTENLRSDFEEHKEVFKKVTGDMDKKIRGIRQDLSGIYDKAKRYEEIETKEEFMFILETIGAKVDKRIFKGRLLNLYRKKFNFDSREELILSFNMNITLLKKCNLINYVIMAGSVFYVITNEGLEYLRLARIKIKEEKGENSR